VANSEHTEILRRGPRAWNAWRQDNPSHIPNLDDAALSLSERQLGPINGGPINLRSARWRTWTSVVINRHAWSSFPGN
jgi:hypothetical protein